MIAETTMERDDFKKCERFHGHVCPGLAIGYQASKAALAWLEENRSVDEEIVAIVENDACCVDAIQVLTGCTFGKGNFIFKDHGKMVFTFFSRNTGKGVRISMKPGVLEPDERHRQLIEKVRENKATDQDRDEFAQLHQQRTKDILNKSLESLFKMEITTVELPPKARMEHSAICQLCGEHTMTSMLELVVDKMICRDCL
ncbi:MAG: FmdE family protein [Desulfobacterales bacterium]|nr:FmdE family protein [Desulfobacterales bacterium]